MKRIRTGGEFGYAKPREKCEMSVKQAPTNRRRCLFSKERAMKPFHLGFGLMLALLASQSRLAGQDKDKDKPADAPKEESDVPYDSKTHGALQVKSVSDKPTDWFDVLQNGKRAYSGNPKLLNSTVELAPGTYDVDVNRTRRKVTIDAGKKTILQTG